jgi:hypothetical protein
MHKQNSMNVAENAIEGAKDLTVRKQASLV